MSGPKVVRVVTREEIAARCSVALAALRAAATDLKACLAKHGGNEQATLTAVDERVRAIEDDLAALRVNGLEARIATATSFMRSESARMLAEAQRKAELKRESDRRAIEAARTISNTLGKGHPFTERLHVAMGAAKGFNQGALDGLKALTEAAYSELKVRAVQQADSSADKNMAARLMAGQDMSLTQWVSSNVRPVSGDARVERLLVQMQLIGDAADSLIRRASELYEMGESDRRSAMTDSLVLELSEAVARLKRLAELRTKANALEHALSAIGAEGERLARALRKAADNPDEVALRGLIAQSEAAIGRHVADTSATARRRAILDGLRGLGYAVQGSMETAWVKSGRIVISRPDDEDYGVELGASQDAQTMQVRLVGASRPSRARSAQRDTGVEQKWCSEFEALRKLVAKAGTEVTIRRAVGVGIEPVRSVENADLERARIADAVLSAPQTLKK